MSNLLKEAIVDAQALREAALKNAEAAIVDKYSTEVRETLEQLLEQDEPNLDEDAPAEGDASLEEDVEDVPLAATDGLSEMEGDNLNQLAEEGEDVEINLDLGALKEALQEMTVAPIEDVVQESEEDLDEDIEIEESILAALLEDEDTIKIEDPAEQDEEAMKGMEEGLFDFFRKSPEEKLVDFALALKRYTEEDTTPKEQREFIKMKQQIVGDEDTRDLISKLQTDAGGDLKKGLMDFLRDQGKMPEDSPERMRAKDRLAQMKAQMKAAGSLEEDIEEGYYPGHSDPDYHPYDDDADIRNDPRNRRRKPATPAKDRNRTKDRYTRRDYERDYQREQFEISDELLDSIVEKLTVDMGADLAGWAGRSAEDKKFQMEKEIAHRRSTDMEEELDTLKKAQEELVFENSQLSEQLDNLKRAAIEMKESLQDVNLSNARLLYTNRVLRNTSLNERQKDRIVEAISKSDSVTEARTIFNTLQSTVESVPNRGPKTLSEAISRPTSVIRASRAESTPKQDAFAERMKRLAGIK